MDSVTQTTGPTCMNEFIVRKHQVVLSVWLHVDTVPASNCAPLLAIARPVFVTTCDWSNPAGFVTMDCVCAANA
jgi:hypothetical protein